MKKFVVFMLSVFLLVCCAIGFMACTGGGNDSGDTDKPSTEEPNNPNNPDDGDNEGGGNEPEISKISVGAYIDGSLYQTVYTDENAGYKIETPVISDDITTNPNSERYFYGWFMDKNFQTPVTDDTVFKEDDSIYGTWIDVYSNDFKYSVSQGEATITGFNHNTATVVVVPCYINSFPVTTIGESAFSNKTMIKTLIICDGIQTIEKSAFYNCNSMNKVVIPNSVTNLSGFQDCSSLFEIKIPNSVTSIGVAAFSFCSGLTSIEIPNSVTTIGGHAFSYCSNLTSIEIPNGVTSIGNSAFYGCSGLTSIEIPNSVTIMDDSALAYCSELKEIELSSNIVSIEEDTFRYCIKLETINIPDGIKTIKRGAFSGCSNLVNIEIPNSIIKIEVNAFENCNKLIEIDNGIEYVNQWLVGYTVEKDVIDVREGTIGIADNALSHGYTTSNFTKVSLPNTLKYIGNSAFFDCMDLEEINIPKSVVSIGSSAFYRCFDLETIIIPANVIEIGGGCFYFCRNLTIYTEFKSKPTGWSDSWNQFDSAPIKYIPVIWGYKGD